MIGIFVAAEVRIYREGLVAALRRHAGIDVVAAGRSLEEIRAATKRHHLDLVLLDMLIPSRLAILNALRFERPAPRVVALGVSEDDEETIACAELGIFGLVSREASLKQVVAAITGAMRGEFQCSPRAAGLIASRLAALSCPSPDTASNFPLTRREAEIVYLIDHGLSNKEIANRLAIEMATVKNHVHNVLRKLKVRRRGEAAARVRATASTLLPGITAAFPENQQAHAK